MKSMHGVLVEMVMLVDFWSVGRTSHALTCLADNCCNGFILRGSLFSVQYASTFPFVVHSKGRFHPKVFGFPN